MASGSHSIGIAYLLRGADPDWETACQRFIKSYLAHPAGQNHRMHVITKVFESSADEARARELLSALDCFTISVNDDSFDIGAYRDWAKQTSEESICLLNTGSEILSDYWLKKLHANLLNQGIGVVGATGSFERFGGSRHGFPRFPNAHIRTTAFMLKRELYLNATQGKTFDNKMNTFLFESGHQSLTRIIKELGLKAIVVGRNGRGYGERHWATSGTFRQGNQANLLIGDRNTRNFSNCSWPVKQVLTKSAWGKFRKRCDLYRWC